MAFVTFDGEVRWLQDFTSDDSKIRYAVKSVKTGSRMQARMLDGDGLAGETHGDFFTRGGGAPNRHIRLALQDHVIAKNGRQLDIGANEAAKRRYQGHQQTDSRYRIHSASAAIVRHHRCGRAALRDAASPARRAG